MADKKNIFEKHPILTIFVIILFIIIFFDFVLGLIFIPKDYNTFRVQNEYYHHGLSPNKSVLTKWGEIEYSLYTNSLGFRDFSVRDVPLKSDKKRLLIMGDSHTEAVGVPFEKSFTGTLISLSDTSKVDILNGAAVSYSPRLYYLKTKYLIEHVGLDIDELYVFIDISDIQNEIAYQHFEPQSINFNEKLSYHFKKFFERHSITFYSVATISKAKHREEFYKKTRSYFKGRVDNQTELYATFFDKMDDEELLNNPDFHEVGYWLGNPKYMKLWGQEGLKLGAKQMEKLLDLCKKNDIKLTISVHPWIPQILNKDIHPVYVDFWQKFAENYGIGFINMFPLFINDQDPETIVKEYYIHNDNHWNEKGHQLVGRSLAPYIH